MSPLPNIRFAADRAIAALERDGIPFWRPALAFLSAVTIRCFAEIFVDRVDLPPDRLIHYALFYVPVALAILLVFRVAAKVPAGLAARAVLPGFALVLVAPILDLALSGGVGYDIAYMRPGRCDPLDAYLTFFGSVETCGVTPGIRVEVALALVGCVLYLRSKGAGYPRVALGALAIYTAVFAHGMLPFWARWSFSALGLECHFGDLLAARLLAVSSLVIGGVLLLLSKPRETLGPVGIAGFGHAAHAVALLGLGVAFGVVDLGPSLGSHDLLRLALAPVALALAALSGGAIQTASRRSGGSDPGHALRVARACAAISLACALLASFETFVAAAVMLAARALRVTRPMRLERIPIAGWLPESVGALAALFAGYALLGGEAARFPRPIALYVVAGLGLAANALDLATVERDLKERRRTIPTLLGRRAAGAIVGAAIAALHALAYLAFDDPMALVPLAIAAGAHIWLVNRRRFDARPAVALYLVEVAALAAYAAAAAPGTFLSSMACSG